MTPEAFPIYVTLAIYILAMFAVTFIANRQNSAAEAELGEDGASTSEQNMRKQEQ